MITKVKAGTKGWFENRLCSGEDVAEFSEDTDVEVSEHNEYWYKATNVIGFPKDAVILICKRDLERGE